MRLIDADARVTVQSFDVEHEEYNHTEMSVEEALDFATDEGCPSVVDAEPVVRCKDCKFYPNGYGTTKWVPCREIVTLPRWYCADGEREEDSE